VGFRRLRDYMERAARDPSYKPGFVGRAYVLFAIENSGLFLLMFRSALLDSKNPTLQKERGNTFSFLSQSRDVKLENPTLEQLGALTAGWAMVHGFAMLYIHGNLNRVLRYAPPGTEPLDLLQAAISARALST
jgi:hypothetical protein